MATQQEVIKKFMKSLDTTNKISTKAVDEALAACSNFKTLQEAVDKMVADCKAAKSADDFLKTYCGIDLTNTDTGAITGKDAGGSVVKTKESIVPEKNSAKNFTENQFTVNGLTVKLEKNVKNLSPYEQYLWNNLHEHWIKNSLDLIAQSYGDNFSFNKDSSVKEITVTFINEHNYIAAAVTPAFASNDVLRKTTTGLNLQINLYYYKLDNFSSEDSDGKPNGLGIIYEAGYLDRNIAHEMTHAVMQVNIDYCNLLPRVVLEGMAELTHGADDGGRKNDIKALAADFSKLESALNGSTAVSGVSNPAYSSGYMFLRYLANQSASAELNVDSTKNNISITGTDYADTIINSGTKVTITGGKGADTISNISKSGRGTGNYSLINGGDDKDSISVSGSYYVSVYGGSGNDTIIDYGGYRNYLDGGAGNDLISVQSTYWDYTLTGGSGNDTIISNTKGTLFKYASGDGNDLIRGFTSSDTLSISGGAYTSIKSGKNYVFTVGDGKITLEGAASLSSVNVSGEYKNPLLIVGKETADNLNNTLAGATIQALGGNDTITNTGSKASILAGAGNDIINEVGSTSHNNTIAGGKGNDTINLASGAGTSDVIEYSAGDGNDLITGFNDTSTLKIGGGSGTYFSYFIDDDRFVQVGENTITLSGAASLSKVNISGKRSTTLTLTDDMGKYSNWTLGSTTKIVDASKRTKAIKITANALANSLVGGSGNDTFLGGKGNDTLKGGKGNDSLSGGDGADVFLYAKGDGSDTITDYEEEDLIKITSGKIDKISTTSAGSVVFKIGDGRLTLKNSADKIVSYEDADGKKSFYPMKFNSKGTAATLQAAYVKDSFDFAAFDGLKNLDATKVKNGLRVTGNTLNNKIIGSASNDSIFGGAGKDSLYGGDGNDKLWGGDGTDYLVGGDGKDSLYGNADNDKLYGNAGNDLLSGGAGNDLLYGDEGNDKLWGDAGNDSLWGGAGDDTFIYKPGEGTDRIYDFETGDMLKILNADGSNGSFKSSKYSGGDLTLTINGGGKIILYDVSTSDKFNINGTTYKISGSKLK